MGFSSGTEAVVCRRSEGIDSLYIPSEASDVSKTNPGWNPGRHFFRHGLRVGSEYEYTTTATTTVLGPIPNGAGTMVLRVVFLFLKQGKRVVKYRKNQSVPKVA